MRPTDKVYSAAKLFFAYGLGNAGYFPMSVGAQSVLYPHRPTPDGVFDLITRHRPTIFFGVPTLYAAMLAAKDGGARDSTSRRSVSACRRARRCRRTSTAAGASASAWRSSTASAPPRRGHIFLSNRPGAVRPGLVGPPGPRLRVRDRRRRGPTGTRGRDREPPGPRRLDHGLLLEPARQDEGDALRAVDPDRRQVPPGRRRLLLVRRPRRRHAEGRRDLGLADRGRGDPDPARRGARGRGGRPGGRRPAGQAPRLRRPEGRRPAPARRWPPSSALFVKDKIAPYKYPRWIDFVPELPKTATGKIQRFKLRQGPAGA